MSSTHLLPFAVQDNALAADLDTVGGKGQSLASMTAAGFPVPAGFTVTTTAYRQFVSDNDLQQTILDLAKPELVGTAVSFDSASQQIQALFAEAELTDELKAQIGSAYTAFGAGEPPVAVRSSANAEDLPDLSFAGQQDTYLNIRGRDAVYASVRDCWASLWTARALSYRHEHAIAQDAVAMAVVVQKMVPSEVSGILFTANPATGERSEMIVNASFGLGEAIVGGEITPDTYIIDRDKGGQGDHHRQQGAHAGVRCRPGYRHPGVERGGTGTVVAGGAGVAGTDPTRHRRPDSDNSVSTAPSYMTATSPGAAPRPTELFPLGTILSATSESPIPQVQPAQRHFRLQAPTHAWPNCSHWEQS